MKTNRYRRRCFTIAYICIYFNAYDQIGIQYSDEIAYSSCPESVPNNAKTKIRTLSGLEHYGEKTPFRGTDSSPHRATSTGRTDTQTPHHTEKKKRKQHTHQSETPKKRKIQHYGGTTTIAKIKFEENFIEKSIF